MDLHDGTLFWPTTYKAKDFESLTEDSECDVLIIGGGMSGMLCAYKLSNEGYKVILVEKNGIAEGSSSANTGLLQYSSDIMMYKLAQEIGEEKAFLFYDMCLKAMRDFDNLPKALKDASDLIMRDSLYLASTEDDVKDLKNECEMLKKYNFPVEFLSEQELLIRHNIKAPAALKTMKDAEINPYKFIYSLARFSQAENLSIFENTEAIKMNYKKEMHEVNTKNAIIKSKYVILATGYEGDRYKEIKKGDLNRTYAIATKQLDSLPWNDHSMIWETATPYLYARMTIDNRIVAGGLDQHSQTINHDKNYINRKGKEILEQLKEFIPNLETEVEYVWEAIFGESTDEMPFIGEDPHQERLFYCLGFGGNGTVYSMAGANIISDLLKNKNNPYSEIVKVNR